MASSAEPIIHRPIPRRPYDLPEDTPPTPTTEYPDLPPKRSRSFASLTTSTLFGIFSDGEISTPTQLSRNSSLLNIPEGVSISPTTASDPEKSLRHREEAAAAAIHPPKQPAAEYAWALMWRVASLFALGVAYGVIVTHLHDRSVQRGGGVGLDLGVDRGHPLYLGFWGVAGVGLGSLLPWLDGARMHSKGRDWSEAVRSVGAFVGIAYAIRKLPWESTLQVSATLALVNPFLWYLIDRTRAGFWFSALVGCAGTICLLTTNPNMILSPVKERQPKPELVAGLLTSQSIGVSTWIASVLFCSCVCFGNVGRKLALWVDDDGAEVKPRPSPAK